MGVERREQEGEERKGKEGVKKSERRRGNGDEGKKKREMELSKVF